MLINLKIWSIANRYMELLYLKKRDCHGHDHMVVGFTTTYANIVNHH